MTIYVLNCYIEKANSLPRINSYELFETEELAIKRLRRYAEEIKSGKWIDCTFLEWHDADADADEVTWLLYSRKNVTNGNETELLRVAVEECSVCSK